MELQRASIIANHVKSVLSPFCTRIEVAGSIRRRRSVVHDIDLVVIPSNQGQFITALQSLGAFKLGGQKLIRCELKEGLMLDVYIATPKTWATLLLIRTGSKEHNIKLCTQAKNMGMILHADGRGLVVPGPASIYGPPSIGEDSPVSCETEESIFEVLGLPYKKPEDR